MSLISCGWNSLFWDSARCLAASDGWRDTHPEMHFYVPKY